MKFPYKVKYNGKYYAPNTEIKESKAKETKVEEPKTEKKAVKGDK